MKKSLQAQFAEKSICFGCGPANPHGLQLACYAEGERVTATFMPKPHHHAFPGVLNGGIIGTLLDCHCNWASCYFLQQDQGLETPPGTVTAEYTIKLKRPAPVDQELNLTAELISIKGQTAWIKGKLCAGDKLFATCEGKFVAVPEDHPGYHRW